ncbi:MAG: hypothetical protein RJB67_425 [Bacteroidota bacterium]|jgi:hypothetical protein
MKIAVTIVGIRDTNFSSVGRFIWKWLEGEIHAHPEHQFVLLSDTAQPTSFVGAPNCSWIKTKYDRNRLLSEKIWYELTAPKLLAPLQPALWLQLSGRHSVRTNIPQICLFEDNLTKLQRYFFKKNVHKVKQWLVLENQAAQQLEAQFGISKESIATISMGPSSEIYPIDYNLQQMYKGTHAGGTEYFLSVANEDKSSIELLQAFSQFKKWQQSNMKLLLVPSNGIQRSFLEEKLRTYKYRADVIVVPAGLTVHNWYQLVSSAYATVLLGDSAPNQLLALEAAKAGVSVIAQDSFAKAMHMEDRVTRYLETTPSSIAEALLLVYKNEKIKGERIQNGLLFLQNINFTQSLPLFKEI